MTDMTKRDSLSALEVIGELQRFYCYSSDDSLRGTMETNRRNQAIDIAVDCVRKHTPAPPLYIEDEKCSEAYCPSCGERLDDTYYGCWNGEIICDRCSQRIEWGGANA